MHRVLGFTRHLPRHGWACTVVCAGAGDYWVTDPSLVTRVPAETEVIRAEGGSGLATWLRMRPRDRGRRPGGVFAGLRRLSDWFLFPDAYAGWARRATDAVRERLGRGGIDVVLTSSPPDSAHVPGLDTRGATRAPWVADFRDPWMGLEFRTPPTAWHRGRQRRLESRVLAGADRVLAASRTHADALRRRFIASGADPAKVVHLPNGYEAGDDAPVPFTPDPTSFRLVYTGMLSLMPDIEVCLEAVHDVLARVPEARQRMRARLLGPFDANLEHRARALGLTGIVEFAGPRPHAESRAAQAGADVLLHWQPHAFPTMVPGKLYEYFESGRPVLAVLDPATEAAALIREAGGTVVAPGDRDALAAEIERRYVAWASGVTTPTRRPEGLEAHRRDRLAARLAGVLDELVETPRARTSEPSGGTPA